MRSQAWVPLVATVISLEFTLALLRRWRVSRRSYLRSWLISFVFFTAGTAALWYGVAFGWSSPSLRFYYLCGAFLSVPWLALGELELLMAPKATRIMAFFLMLITVNGAFVFGAIPFLAGKTVAGPAIPVGAEFFPAGVIVAVALSNSIGTLIVVGGTLWSGWRSRGRGPAATSRFRGTLLITIGVGFAAAGGALTFLGKENALAGSLAIGVAIMYSGFVIASRRPGAHRAARRRRRDRTPEETVDPGHLLDRDSDPSAELVSAP